MPEATIEPTPLKWLGTIEGWPTEMWKIGLSYFVKREYHGLSTHYFAETVKIRPPIVVMCPALHHWEDGSRPDELHCTPFCIDSYPTDGILHQ